MHSNRAIFGGFVLLVALLAYGLYAADGQAFRVRQSLLQALCPIEALWAKALLHLDPNVTGELTPRAAVDYLRATPSPVACDAILKEHDKSPVWPSIHGILHPPGNPAKGTSCHTVTYFRTINMVSVALLLLIPAIALYTIRFRDGGGRYWLIFWTAAYVAFVLHLYYGVEGILGGHFSWIKQDVTDPPRVTHPITDSITVVWWTLDVVLAWIPALRPQRWIKWERSALVLALFLSATGSSVGLSSNSYVRFLGVALVVCTLSAIGYRVFHSHQH
jgi:hypothetical protein